MFCKKKLQFSKFKLFTYLEDSFLFTTVKNGFISIIVLIQYIHVIFITHNKSCINLSPHGCHAYFFAIFMISKNVFFKKLFGFLFFYFWIFYLRCDCPVCA